MNDPINEQNLAADKITYGKWSKRGDQFGDEEPLRLLFEMFTGAGITNLPPSLSVIEFGSADGIVGEYFSKKLTEAGHKVQLSLVDVIKEHLDANENPDTIKIHANLLNFSTTEKYDIGIVRSIFHYFSLENQKIVLENIYKSLKPGGWFLSQNFIQNEVDLGLYKELNKEIGKDFQLISEESVRSMLMSAGFVEVQKLGDISNWHYAASALKKRYDLSGTMISKMRDRIITTPPENRAGFEVTEDGFTVPVPYKVFLARKPL